MSKKHSDSSDNERRDYFRLSNKLLIEYRKASLHEVEAFISSEENIKADEIDVTYQLDKISRQLSPLIISVRQESSAIAQYLDLLNQKVDIVISMLAFDRITAGQTNPNLFQAETHDISEGGMSFLSTEEFDLGDLIYCKLAIVGFRLGMETFGKIVRCDKTSKSEFLLGVELPYLKELDRKNLTRFIFDKQREQLQKR